MSAKLLFFDCETTGLPTRRNASPFDVSAWPRLVQLAWGTFDELGNTDGINSHVVRPEGFVIPAESTRIHGISHELALREGRDLSGVLDEFSAAVDDPKILLVAHNLAFDLGVVGAEIVRANKPRHLFEIPWLCTMETTTELCCLPRWGSGGFKWPTLQELHVHLFGNPYDHAHDAASDLNACARCFFELLGAGFYSVPSRIS